MKMYPLNNVVACSSCGNKLVDSDAYRKTESPYTCSFGCSKELHEAINNLDAAMGRLQKVKAFVKEAS